jgi:CheY-like chemotaxis protein
MREPFPSSRSEPLSAAFVADAGYLELGSIKVLVVDDDKEVRAIVAEALGNFGYGVVQAANGNEALALLQRDCEIGVLITDVRMPGMSGLELAETARRDHADLKIIVISGYFVPQRVGHRFLAKPFHMQELASAVQSEIG